jgi:hypothetical protein
VSLKCRTRVFWIFVSFKNLTCCLDVYYFFSKDLVVHILSGLPLSGAQLSRLYHEHQPKGGNEEWKEIARCSWNRHAFQYENSRVKAMQLDEVNAH